jgi:dihydrofolate synthase / folylpolyglutamate synthase
MVLKGVDQHRWSLGLDRMKRALDALGHPEKSYPHVLVAGTNGKGSTCIYLEHMLLTSGRTVGTTISPHLSNFSERFRINGRQPSTIEINRLRVEIEPKVVSIDLTYFEWCVVLAAVLFARNKVDVGIFEVGLGGRYDASNALDPAISLISGISIDHTDYLGRTISRIAREKAAIARTGRPLITTATGKALQTIRAEAEIIGAKIIEISDSSIIPDDRVVEKQGLNAALAYHAAGLLGARIKRNDLVYAIRTSFLPGRIEKLGDNIIMDVAHNPSSMLVLVKHLKKSRFKGVGVVGILVDKDYHTLIRMLKKVCSHLYIAPVQSPRSWGKADMECIEGLGGITICESITEAFFKAVHTGQPLVITGSFYTVGEVRENLVCHGWPS